MTFLGIEVEYLFHSWWSVLAKFFMGLLVDVEALHGEFCEPCWA